MGLREKDLWDSGDSAIATCHSPLGYVGLRHFRVKSKGPLVIGGSLEFESSLFVSSCRHSATVEF